MCRVLRNDLNAECFKNYISESILIPLYCSGSYLCKCLCGCVYIEQIETESPYEYDETVFLLNVSNGSNSGPRPFVYDTVPSILLSNREQTY